MISNRCDKMFSEKEGQYAVRKARETIQRVLNDEEPITADAEGNFLKDCGVFVTLNTFPNHKLRGCIGYPEPVQPLINSLVDSAISAATRDPRFHQVKSKELENIVVEVSLLTPPEQIKVKKVTQILDEIKVGRDGLIIERRPYRGLLLPQVPVEHNWEAEEFLQHTCMKAGLPADTWVEKGTKIFRFQAEIFTEMEPGGKIIRKDLG
jgi:uncharacterized protein (TIGR00296 family)